MSHNLTGKHCLSLQDFSSDEIMYLLDTAKQLKHKKQQGVRDELLKGKNIVLIFEKPSTRTLCAFEVAAFDEGANVTRLDNTHFGKKESVEDSARVLGRFYDGIGFRGFAHDTVTTLAKHAGIPVWNGLTDDYHPTQILADFLTIQEHVKKPLKDMKIVFVGDARNNVATSLMIGCAKMGAQFVALAPKALWPDALQGSHSDYTDNIDHAVKGADVIYTDVWVSMGEENQFDARIKQLRAYQVNRAMLDSTGKPNVIFMHCLPAFHDTNTLVGSDIHAKFGLTDMEVTDEIFRSSHSVVFDQAENRLHTLKAVMVATLIS